MKWKNQFFVISFSFLFSTIHVKADHHIEFQQPGIDLPRTPCHTIFPIQYIHKPRSVRLRYPYPMCTQS